jgi:hypothetical protein
MDGTYLYTVDQLRTALQTNGAKVDKFTIRFGTPSGNGSFTLGSDAILCKATSFPSKTIGTAEVWVQGRKLPLPGDTTFEEEWEVTFYNTTDHKLRQMFINWMTAIDNYTTNRHICDPSLYMIEAEVMQLDCNGGVASAYRFFNMFPANIQAVELDGSQINEVQQFRVSFKFSHWEPVVL